MTVTDLDPAASVDAVPALVYPGVTVAPPARTPLPYGLFSVVPFRPEGDGRWQGSGAQWESLACDPLEGRGGDTCDPDDPPVGLPKTLDTGNLISGANPFVVYGDFSCSPLGWSPADAADRAQQHLLAREEQRVENAFWTGNLGNTPNLVGSEPERVLNAEAQTVVEGLAYLEFVIATRYGSLGVIHMTRGMALVGLAQQALETRGGRLYTRLGTPVVAGTGYDGSGPTGSDPLASGESWAYATPALLGYRSDVFTSSNRPGDLLDRRTNDLTAIAERAYLLGYDDCGTAAVLLRLTSDLATGG